MATIVALLFSAIALLSCPLNTPTSTAKAVPSMGRFIGRGWFEDGTPGFRFDCSGKVDGNYPHPTKCTHYVACVDQTLAYELACAENKDGNRLHFVPWSGPDPSKSLCDYPHTTGCEEKRKFQLQ